MNHRITIPAAALIGFFAGFAAHRPLETPSEGKTARISSPARKSSGTAAAIVSAAKAAPVMKSTDTPDTLLALDDAGQLYAKLALWQLDAPESELAAFWASYRTREKRDTEVLDLLFSQWTRKNPQAAIEAAKGSDHEGIPWWAWAINDPNAAIAAARGASKEMAGFVMRAIGQFHPDRALRVLAENPGFAQWNGIEGIANGLTRNDPLAALEFQKAHDRMHDSKAMEKLTRDDPQAALEWLRDQSGRDDSYSEQAFLRTLERETPEMLAELAASAPSGDLKWKLERAAFRHLAEGNPTEALSQARSAASSRLAAERLAVVGRAMVERDPQGALDVFQELFKACPDATDRTLWTRYPNGASGGSGTIDGVREFINGLVAIDPQAVMAAASPQNDSNRSITGSISRAWAEQDLNGFGKWVDGQQPGPAYDQGAVIMSEQLAAQEDFSEALDWATRVTSPDRRLSPATQVFQNWLHRDREAAMGWYGKAELPEDLRKNLELYLPRK
jgi:hypothetical protein